MHLATVFPLVYTLTKCFQTAFAGLTPLNMVHAGLLKFHTNMGNQLSCGSLSTQIRNLIVTLGSSGTELKSPLLLSHSQMMYANINCLVLVD